VRGGRSDIVTHSYIHIDVELAEIGQLVPWRLN